MQQNQDNVFNIQICSKEYIHYIHNRSASILLLQFKTHIINMVRIKCGTGIRNRNFRPIREGTVESPAQYNKEISYWN